MSRLIASCQRLRMSSGSLCTPVVSLGRLQQKFGTSFFGARSFWSPSTIPSFSDFWNPSLGPETQPLFDLTGMDSSSPIDSFKAYNDADYGGRSSSSVEIVQDNENDANGDGSDPQYARLFGTLDLDEDLKKSLEVVGGFVAYKGIPNRSIDLRDCEGIQLVLRCNKNLKLYVNMWASQLFLDDTFQAGCELQASSNGQWTTIKIPFDKFILTANGMERDFQRLNDSLQCEGIGLLLKTQENSDAKDFHIDVKSIKALGTMEEE